MSNPTTTAAPGADDQQLPATFTTTDPNGTDSAGASVTIKPPASVGDPLSGVTLPAESPDPVDIKPALNAIADALVSVQLSLTKAIADHAAGRATGRSPTSGMLLPNGRGMMIEALRDIDRAREALLELADPNRVFYP